MPLGLGDEVGDLERVRAGEETEVPEARRRDALGPDPNLLPSGANAACVIAWS